MDGPAEEVVLQGIQRPEFAVAAHMRQKIISGLFFPCSGVTVLPVDLGADFLPPHPQQVGPIPVYLSAGFFGIEGSVQPLRCPALHPQRPCQWICPARLGTSSSSYATPLHHGMGQVLILPHLRLGQLAVLLRILPVSQSAPDVAGHISLIRRNLPLFLLSGLWCHFLSALAFWSGPGILWPLCAVLTCRVPWQLRAAI